MLTNYNGTAITDDTSDSLTVAPPSIITTIKELFRKRAALKKSAELVKAKNAAIEKVKIEASKLDKQLVFCKWLG